MKLSYLSGAGYARVSLAAALFASMSTTVLAGVPTITLQPTNQSSVVLTKTNTIAAGAYNSVVIKDDGTAWAVGSPPLGDGTSLQRTTPVKVTGLTNVISVAAGQVHMLALRKDGTVWAWGANGAAQLGQGYTSSSPSLVPVQVPGLSNVVAIAAGCYHSVALKSDGTVWQWGYIQTWSGSVILNSLSPTLLWSNGVVAIAAGYEHTLGLRADGSISGWGMGSDGELGVAGSVSPAVGIAAGCYGLSSLALKNDGTVWSSGNWLQMPSGTGPNAVSGLSSIVSISANNISGVALKSDGTVWAFGGSSPNGITPVYATSPPAQVPNITGAVAVAQGFTGAWNFGLALRSDGTVWGWGENWYGQLGNGASGIGLTSWPAVQMSGITGVSPNRIVSAPVTFSVSASGSPAPTFQWQRQLAGQSGFSNLSDDATFSGTSNSALTIGFSSPAMSGDQFRCIISNADGSVTSAAASLAVYCPAATPAITSQPTNQVATTGSSATFSVGAVGYSDVTYVGSTGLHYQWLKNGSAIGGATGAALTLNNVSSGDAANYSVVVSGSFASTTSASAALALDDVAPSVPSSLAANNVGAGGFTLTWTSSTDNVGVTAYEIRQDGASIGTSASAVKVISGLAANSTYQVSVRARDLAGNWSNWSTAFAVTTNSSLAPVASFTVGTQSTTVPATVSFTQTCTSPDGTPLSFAWDFDGNGTIDSHEANPVCAYSTSGVYKVALTVTNSSGLTATVTQNVLVSDPPSTTNIYNGGGSIYPGGTDEENNSYSGSQDSHPVYVPQAGTLIVTVTQSSGTPQIVADGAGYVAGGQTVTILVHGSDDSAEGSYSIAVALAPDGQDLVAPTVPESLVASNLGTSSFTLSWAASTDDAGVTAYEVFKNGALSGTTTATSMNITGVSALIPCVVTVRARDAVGHRSGQSKPLAVVLPDISPPTAPAALNYAERTATSVTLIWRASMDDVAVIGYAIYRGGTLVGSTSDLVFADSGLTASTTYSYTAKAFDAAGNYSAASTALSVTTTADFSADSDHDGIPDATETALGTNGSSAASADTTNQTQQNIHRPKP